MLNFSPPPPAENLCCPSWEAARQCLSMGGHNPSHQLFRQITLGSLSPRSMAPDLSCPSSSLDFPLLSSRIVGQTSPHIANLEFSVTNSWVDIISHLCSLQPSGLATIHRPHPLSLLRPILRPCLAAAACECYVLWPFNSIWPQHFLLSPPFLALS